jgi:hypothetical protein
MKENENVLVSGLTVFLLILWLGFFIHRDPRFAGSLVGGLFAVVGALFLLIPLLYSFIKRLNWVKSKITQKISLPTLLSIHIYAGVVGAILVLIHTGHKFDGPLATTLTAVLLVEIASGFIGRYIFGQTVKDLNDKKRLSVSLENLYMKKTAELAAQSEDLSAFKAFSGFFSRIFAQLFLHGAETSSPINKAAEVIKLATAVSDVDYSIKTHELFKRLFSYWLKFHIVTSFIFYSLLFLHIGGEIYLGLRWFK